MSENRIRLYEGLFLLAQNATTDLAAAVEMVKTILTRHQAEIVVLRKWDERKLAYPIHGQKRGTYILAYFKAPALMVTAIDRDCTLSENILRALFLKADHMGDVEIELAKKEETLALEAKLRAESEPKPVEKVLPTSVIEVPEEASIDGPIERE